jgi:hypothetical protein
MVAPAPIDAELFALHSTLSKRQELLDEQLLRHKRAHATRLWCEERTSRRGERTQAAKHTLRRASTDVASSARRPRYSPRPRRRVRPLTAAARCRPAVAELGDIAKVMAMAKAKKK